jgi:hypothetical protein
MEPAMRRLYTNEASCKTIATNYEKFKRRLDEMEFIFLKVTRNASSHKEMVHQIETAETAMRKARQQLDEERDNTN